VAGALSETLAITARSRDVELRQLLDVSQAVLRQSEAMAQNAEEGKERAKTRIQWSEG